MARKSKREIERDVQSLAPETNEEAPVIALERSDGSYVDKDGNPIEDVSECLFSLSPDIWKTWDKTAMDLPADVGADDAEE